MVGAMVLWLLEETDDQEVMSSKPSNRYKMDHLLQLFALKVYCCLRTRKIYEKEAGDRWPISNK